MCADGDIEEGNLCSEVKFQVIQLNKTSCWAKCEISACSGYKREKNKLNWLATIAEVVMLESLCLIN